jgi:SAM domain (Sterile alpha motif)
MDVANWLQNLGLEQYEAAFRQNGLNAEILRHLTADDLKDLGVAAVGHRRQLLVAIAAIKHMPADDATRSATSLTENLGASETEPYTSS